MTINYNFLFKNFYFYLQEAEIKFMAAQTQFAEMPLACHPYKMGLWDKMIASLFREYCVYNTIYI